MSCLECAVCLLLLLLLLLLKMMRSHAFKSVIVLLQRNERFKHWSAYRGVEQRDDLGPRDGLPLDTAAHRTVRQRGNLQIVIKRLLVFIKGEITIFTNTRSPLTRLCVLQRAKYPHRNYTNFIKSLERLTKLPASLFTMRSSK